MKKKLFLTLTVLLLTLGSFSVRASDQMPDEDFEKLVTFVKTQTVVLKRPVTIFHWFSDHEIAQLDKASDPKGYDYVKLGALSYTVDPDPRSGSYYGNGMYFAPDPEGTQFYLGTHGTDKWGMVQLQMPKGFRVLNLQNDITLPSGLYSAMRRMGCYNLNQLFNQKLMSCFRVGVKLIDRLELDGFTYKYNEIPTNIAECPNPQDHQIALVLTSPDRIKPSDVKVFTPKTQDDEIDRLRIQTFSYLGGLQDQYGYRNSKINPGTQPPKELLARLYKINPKYKKWTITDVNFSRDPIKNETTFIVSLLDTYNKSATRESKNEWVTLPSSSITWPPLKQFKLGELPSPPTRGFNDLFWPDLEGKKSSADISQWAHKNLYGCSPDQFEKLEDYEKRQIAQKSGGTCPMPVTAASGIEKQYKDIKDCLKAK